MQRVKSGFFSHCVFQANWLPGADTVTFGIAGSQVRRQFPGKGDATKYGLGAQLLVDFIVKRNINQSGRFGKTADPVYKRIGAKPYYHR